MSSIPNHLRECFQVTRADEDEVVKSRVRVVKGPVPRVQVRAQRVQNKKQTVISGLELFQIDLEELVTYLSHKCAGSATLHENETRKETYTVQVQGEHIDTITGALTKRYKIPAKYIEAVNTITSKKRK